MKNLKFLILIIGWLASSGYAIQTPPKYSNENVLNQATDGSENSNILQQVEAMRKEKKKNNHFGKVLRTGLQKTIQLGRSILFPRAELKAIDGFNFSGFKLITDLNDIYLAQPNSSSDMHSWKSILIGSVENLKNAWQVDGKIIFEVLVKNDSRGSHRKLLVFDELKNIQSISSRLLT